MKTKLLILAAILAIPSTLAITVESALAQIQRPIGRAYGLSVTPSASPGFTEDSNGDSIEDLSVITSPLPRFEFSILTELSGQPIIDQVNSPNLGFFPNAISSFAYIVDTDRTSSRRRDDQGNFLPSTQEEEIIRQIIPGTPETSFEGNLIAERLTLGNSGLDLGIIYEFSSEEESISFLLPLDATINSISITDRFLEFDLVINPQVEPIIDSFLATNSLNYIVNQNLFGQELENIISRVTGSDFSSILGTLGVLGDANLFLINPNGIVFGANASLDLGGSFIGSSASNVIFDGFEFSSNNPQGLPLLTINMPIGLGFDDNPGMIINQSVVAEEQGSIGLRVEPNQTLALIGGDISIPGGFLTVNGGRIELGSVAGDSKVNLIPAKTGWQLGYEEVELFQDISLSGFAFLANAGANTDDVRLQGRNITLTEGSLIFSENQGTETGGNLIVKASESLELSGGINFGKFFPSSLSAQVEPGATGNGGTIDIVTNSLVARDGAQIAVSTFDVGNAGNLQINSTDFILLTGASATLGTSRSSGIFVSAQSEVTGNVGELNLTTNLLTVEQGARISANNSGTGESGNATLDVDKLIIRDGGLVGAASLVDANSTSNERGDGGILTINANEVEVSGVSMIAGEEIKSSLFTLAEGTGDAGHLNLFTSSLLVQDGGEVNVSSTGNGSAGNLGITADSIRLDNGNLIAETQVGSQGNIVLNAEDILLQNGNGSLISTNTQNSSGGNIFINTDTLVAFGNSDITANAIQRQGGAIQIIAEGILGIEPRSQLTPFSDITVFSQQSPQLDGVITIETSDADLKRELVSLPTDIIDVTNLVAQGCPAGNRGTDAKKSQFILTGRGGVPPQPEETLRLPAIIIEDDNLAIHQQQISPKVTNKQMVEANSWIINAQGKVVLTASVSPTNAYSYWSNLAKCPDYPNH